MFWSYLDQIDLLITVANCDIGLGSVNLTIGVGGAGTVQMNMYLFAAVIMYM